MNFSYCPHMDRLGHELIEAYRRIDDQDDLWPVRADAPDEIAAIHHRMAEHRKTCPFCHQIANFVVNPTTNKPNILREH